MHSVFVAQKPVPIWLSWDLILCGTDWLFTCWRTVTCDAVCNWCPGLFVRSSSRYLPSLTCFVCYCFSFFCLQSSVCARTFSSCTSCSSFFALNALTLLVGRQEEHLACKNWVMRCCHGYLSRARCKWFAYGPADVTATPSSLGSLKSRLV